MPSSNDALFDRLLSNLDIHVEPFTVCLLSDGWRMHLPANTSVLLHYVFQGRGTLRGPRGNPSPVGPYWMVVVPPRISHSLEVGVVRHERRFGPPPPGQAVPASLVAGDESAPQLVAACGLVEVGYGSQGMFDQLRYVLAVDLSGSPEVRTAFEGIMEEQSNPGPGSEAMQAALMSQCLVHMFRALRHDPAASMPWLTALQHPRLARAMDRILENPGGPHTLDSLAEAACMSRSAFARRFTDAFGTPPMALLHGVRMERAGGVLRQCEDMTIDAVARLAGFASRSHFSRAFKAHHGVPPARYRDLAVES